MDEGYPLDIFVQPKEVEEKGLKCPVCLHVCKDPSLTECGHVFCKRCLETMATEELFDCSVCNKPIGKIASNPYIQRMVNSLTVKCPHCVWTGSLSDLDLHKSKQCQERFLMCVKCNLKHRASETDAHKAECPRRTVPCAQCLAEIQHDLLEIHACPKARIECKLCGIEYLREAQQRHENEECPMECPNLCGKVANKNEIKNHLEFECKTLCFAGCGDKFTGVTLKQHIRDSCPNVPVDCPYMIHGCKDTPMRKELEVHLKEDWKLHSDLACGHKRRRLNDKDLQDLIAAVPQSEIQKSIAEERPEKAKALVSAGVATTVEHLCSAAAHGYTDLVVSLIESNVDVNAENHNGKMPLDFALEANREDVAKRLVLYGAVMEEDMRGPLADRVREFAARM
jgi:hypothetical protein